MPKLDLDKIPLDSGSRYPASLRAAVEGRERKRLGNAAGLDQFGVNLCRLKPGAASSLRHWQQHEDELVYIVEGEVVLCEDGGETLLKAGDVAAWKAGVADGHCLINRTRQDAVLIEIGSRMAVETVTYPDLDLVMVRDQSGARYLRKNGEPYNE